MSIPPKQSPPPAIFPTTQHNRKLQHRCRCPCTCAAPALPLHLPLPLPLLLLLHLLLLLLLLLHLLLLLLLHLLLLLLLLLPLPLPFFLSFPKGICLRSKSKCNKISLSFHKDRRSRTVGKWETPFVFHLFHSSPGYLSSGLEDNLLHLDLESTLLLHLPLRVLLRETWLPSRPLR
jgi:hypothetical protein